MPRAPRATRAPWSRHTGGLDTTKRRVGHLELVEQLPHAIERAVVDRDCVGARGRGDVDADRGHEDRMVG